MTAKKASKQAELNERVVSYFETLEADTITAQELADICERDAKTVRAHLRKINSRDQSEYKNARYQIDAELASTVVDHFDKAKRVVNSE